MSGISKIFKTLALTLAASTFSFADVGLADGAAKFLGNTTTFGEIPDDFGTYWNQITVEYECDWGHVEKVRLVGLRPRLQLGKNKQRIFHVPYTFVGFAKPAVVDQTRY